MTHFDNVAREWDQNIIHTETSQAVAKALLDSIPLNSNMKALEYGAGTGILSFLLREYLSEITMMDSSKEMVSVMHEKVLETGKKNLKPLLFDLLSEDYHARKFDLIFNQMVMHHVDDVDNMLKKFYSLLNPGGYLAIADLYTEDGSFHGPDVNVHKGFDPAEMAAALQSKGFQNAEHKTCFILKRDNGKEYPIFLLTAQK